MKQHPAKFSAPIVEVLTDILLDEMDALGRAPKVIDPFAGVGGIHTAWPVAVGCELEWEWAKQGQRMIQCNALALPFASETIEVVATSPCYGNRMADHHEAKDKSERITYRHKLGRMPSPDSSAVMQWGDEYRAFHVQAWKEVYRVLEMNGLFILNVGDHIRKGEQQKVSAWHNATLKKLGFVPERRIKIQMKKMKKGANRDARVHHEWVIALRKT